MSSEEVGLIPVGKIVTKIKNKGPNKPSEDDKNKFNRPIPTKPVFRSITKKEDDQRRAEEKMLRNTGIPKRYQAITMAEIERRGIPPTVERQAELIKRYIAILDEAIKEGNGLYLRGEAGTMKTTFAIAIMREAMKKNFSCFFISAVSLMDKLFSLPDAERRVFETKIATTDILVVDDLGQEHEKSWIQTKIRALFNERYNNMKTTIITTNLGSQVRELYVESMIDRLQSVNWIIDFKGKSVREKVSQKRSL